MAAAALCISNHAALPLTGQSFEISWMHSVEKIEWKENWSVSGSQIALDNVAIKGSGAGMEPAPHAKLIDGWWQWQPSPPLVVGELVLASSGNTPGGWNICDATPEGQCVTVGMVAGDPIRITPCQ